MIFPELTRLYDRLIQDSEFVDSIPLPRPGESIQKISFEVILDWKGNLVDIIDAKIEKTSFQGKKEKVYFEPKEAVVLGDEHPSGSASTPRFLWDTSAYILGYYPESAKAKEKEKEKARTILFPEYRKFHLKILKDFSIQNKGFQAVCKFLQSWNPENIPKDIKEKLDNFADNFGVFKIHGENKYVYEADEIRNAWERIQSEGNEAVHYGMALDSGDRDVELARLIKPKIKLGSAVGGAALVSFNCASFESYGKKQSYNSPISHEGAFKVCNAINALLKSKKHRIRLQETAIIFWTGKKTSVENSLAWLLGEPPDADEAMDEATLQKMQAFWESIAKAKKPDDIPLDSDDSVPFYMLGLEPNSARIVVRFWHESSLGEFLERLRSHYWALHIEKRFENDSNHLSLYQILRESVRDVKDVPPLLPGALLHSIVEGLPYPTSLYQMVLNRVNISHADSEGKYRCGSKVTYGQAAIIKAFLVRNLKHGEINMSLNPENKAPAYLLGRLFATLEKTQDEASGGVNAGIGDKFYSAASATPRIVFPTLLDLFRKHLKKLEAEKKGLSVIREKLVADLLDDIDSNQGFPANLTLEDRGMFALGYYQQMRAFFSGKGNPDEATQENNN